MNTEGLLDSETSWIAVANTMGHAVLLETLRMANYYAHHSNGAASNHKVWRLHFNEAKSCYLFVQGTGLQVILNRFGLAYDPDKIKSLFNYYLRHD